MNINIVEKTEHIIKLSVDFDNLFNEILNTQQVNKVNNLTKLYIYIRSEHGLLIILLDEFKKSISPSIINPKRI